MNDDVVDIGFERDGTILILTPVGHPRRLDAEVAAREVVKQITVYLRSRGVDPVWTDSGDRIAPSYPDWAAPMVVGLMGELDVRLKEGR